MRKKIIIIVCFLFSNISCIVQTSQIKSECNTRNHFIFPCFECEHPNVINLPDSFRLKPYNYFAVIYVACYFDSLCNITAIKPTQLMIRDKLTCKLIKQYVYFEKWPNKDGTSMPETEAKNFANWAVKELASYTNIKRNFSNNQCKEKLTNQNLIRLEYRLE